MRLIAPKITNFLILIAWVTLLSSCQKAESTALKFSTPMSSSVDKEINMYEKAVENNPKNSTSLVSLGHLYLQKIRETADISYYGKIESLMDKAESIDASNPDTYALKAQVLLGKHQFSKGNSLIKKSIALSPSHASYYGILGDSEIELGNYTGAVAAFQKMVDIRPDYNSYVRIAYIRELYGDIAGAEESFKLAFRAGSAIPENIAFVHVELGKLAMRKSLEEAKSEFTKALETLVSYPPALEWLGKVAYFENDFSWAQIYFKKAYATLPIAQYLIDQADLATLQWKKSEANQTLTLAELSFTTASKSWVDNNLELSFFLTDHDMQKEQALGKALLAYESRQNIYTADNLAWAYYKNDRIEEALELRSEALKLGEADALILYHQGMISLRNNNTEEARKYLSWALTINPHFSLLDSRKARDTINSLQ